MIRPSPTCHRASILLVIAGLLAPSLDAAEIARPASQQEYWAQFDRKDWVAAATAAEKLVADARTRAKQEPLRLSEALNLLGAAQLGKADFPAAEASFGESLKIAEAHVGQSNGALLDPLRGLGNTLAAASRHQEAVPYLERALLISHYSRGLFDISQQGILRQLATSLTKTGQLNEAERHMTYLLRVGQRAYGPNDPRNAQTLCIVADWYGDVGNFTAARTVYRQALGLVERKLGKDDVATVEPLRGLAHSYTQELYYSTLGLRAFQRQRYSTDVDSGVDESRSANPRLLATEGERALERAVKTLTDHPQGTSDTLADALLELGDWYQTKQQPDKAMPVYKRAWSVIEERPKPTDGTPPLPSPMSFPARLYYQLPPAAGRNVTVPDSEVDQRFVQVEFTVTADGLVTDARSTEHDAPDRMVNDTLEAIRAARFRPKFVDGAPVVTNAMSFRETFRIRKPQPEKQTAE